MTFESSKNLGAIGALLVVIGSLATFGSSFALVLDLIGIILILIGLNGLANHYQEKGIFNNALYAFILTIVGGIVFVGILIGTFLASVTTLPFDWTDAMAWQNWITNNATNFSAIWNVFSGIIVGVIAAFLILFIFIVISGIYYRKSFSTLSNKSSVGMFGTAGLLLLIGAVLTIVIIGFLLIWIAFILLIVAFFSLKEQTPPQATATPPPPQ